MSLIQRIKSVLGLNGSTRPEDDRPVAVTVEHDPSVTDDEEADVEDPDTTDERDEVPESIEPEGETEEEPAEDATDPEPEHLADPVIEISGIGQSYSERLEQAGITTVGELIEADPEELAAETDLSSTRIERWIETARDHGSGD